MANKGRDQKAWLLARCAELAKQGRADAGYWSDLACWLEHGCWPEDLRERWAIQHEMDPLPPWAAEYIRGGHRK